MLTVLHAGGKFGGGGYTVSGGLHGVGVSVVNALSSRSTVEIKRDGYRWTQTYSWACPTARWQRHEPTDETGTTVTFWADASRSSRRPTTASRRCRRRLQEMAFLNKGLTIDR